MSKKLSTVIDMPWIFIVIILACLSTQTLGGGETRTLSLYHVHTKESLTITYMRHGKYIPSAMKKINYLMRDWRRNEVITISPRAIDLMWELHADLGSRSPVYILSAYRSSKTHNTSENPDCDAICHGQHIKGNAIDFYFPDVPTIKIRNSALVRQVGGVGYYSSGGGPTGFLHIDSGNVRHWGPAISYKQMSQIMRDYRKTVGARLNLKGMQAVPEVEVAEADPTAAKLPTQQDGGQEGDAESFQAAAKKKVPLETDYAVGDDEELASMSEEISAPHAQPKAKPEISDPALMFDDTELSANNRQRKQELETAKSIKPFIRRLQECWIVPPGAREQSVTIALSISFNPDGSVLGRPDLLSDSQNSIVRITAQSVIAAVMACQKYDDLPQKLLNGSTDLVIEVNPNMFSDQWSVVARLVSRGGDGSQGTEAFNGSLSEICMQALSPDKQRWNTESSALGARKQVDALGITVETCRSQLGLIPGQVAGSDDSVLTSRLSAIAVTGGRIALVVGINDYENLPKLEKAVNDSRAVSQALTNIGYDVVSVENPDRRTLSKKLSELQSKIKPGDNALFYFAGHGVALGGENILIAADMPKPNSGDEDLVRDEGFSVDEIVRRIQKQGAKTAFLVLDACRDNPFEAGGTRSIGGTRGLEKTDAPSGVFVLFSAGIGQAALDRLSDADSNPNSVFTRKLLPVLGTKGLTLTGVAKSVQKEVAELAATINHAQQPAYYDQIIGEVVINPQ